ncbi:MAG: hypothetical protein N2483_02640, partial [Burkholderiaceae bacterium]|nr:hypothetical protein [Burkholderiaceae bacterium]
MLDWLSVTATGPFWAVKMNPGEGADWQGMNMRPGARLVAQSPTSEWGKRYYLLSAEGEKLATILAAPLDRMKHTQDAMVVQFANSTLPTGEYREIGASMWAMGCTFNDVQRIDIAADGWMNDDGTIGGGGDYIG